jgi:hypothetical protein
METDYKLLFSVSLQMFSLSQASLLDLGVEWFGVDEDNIKLGRQRQPGREGQAVQQV